MTVVYLDRVLLLNLLVDYLLLLTTAQLAGIPLRRGRLALCAAVGALYAGAVFLPGLSWLSHPLCRTAGGAAMALAAWRREAHPWRLTALFFLLAGGLGGLVLALGLASGSVAAYVGRLYRAEISWPVLLSASSPPVSSSLPLMLSSSPQMVSQSWPGMRLCFCQKSQ